MNQEQKKPFHELAQTDKNRYEKEVKQYQLMTRNNNTNSSRSCKQTQDQEGLISTYSELSFYSSNEDALSVPSSPYSQKSCTVRNKIYKKSTFAINTKRPRENLEESFEENEKMGFESNSSVVEADKNEEEKLL